MEPPTRQEQAQALLRLEGRRLASSILGRRATTTADFEEAFTLEHVDLVAEIPTPEAMMALGRNIVGPRDGLYVLDDDGNYRVYTQESGIAFEEERGLTFERGREVVIDRLLRLGGLPFVPPGSRDL